MNEIPIWALNRGFERSVLETWIENNFSIYQTLNHLERDFSLEDSLRGRFNGLTLSQLEFLRRAKVELPAPGIPTKYPSLIRELRRATSKSRIRWNDDELQAALARGVDADHLERWIAAGLTGSDCLAALEAERHPDEVAAAASSAPLERQWRAAFPDPVLRTSWQWTGMNCEEAAERRSRPEQPEELWPPEIDALRTQTDLTLWLAAGVPASTCKSWIESGHLPADAMLTRSKSPAPSSARPETFLCIDETTGWLDVHPPEDNPPPVFPVVADDLLAIAATMGNKAAEFFRNMGFDVIILEDEPDVPTYLGVSLDPPKHFVYAVLDDCLYICSRESAETAAHVRRVEAQVAGCATWGEVQALAEDEDLVHDVRTILYQQLWRAWDECDTPDGNPDDETDPWWPDESTPIDHSWMDEPTWFRIDDPSNTAVGLPEVLSSYGEYSSTPIHGDWVSFDPADIDKILDLMRNQGLSVVEDADLLRSAIAD